MERKIGEIFTYKGKTYKILKATDGCRDCALYKQTQERFGIIRTRGLRQ